VSFDGTGEPPADLTSIRIVLSAATPDESGLSSVMGQVSGDGTFTISGVAPGRYRVGVLSAGGWRGKSVDVAGRDALDFLLDVDPERTLPPAAVTLTRRTAGLSGTLTDSAGRPAPAHTIVVFADDPGYWTPYSRRIHALRPSTDGRFSVPSLPAGSYRIVAVDDLEDGQWFDPVVLRALSGSALAITIADGELKTQDLRVAR
jgi:hypothetical protein